MSAPQATVRRYDREARVARGGLGELWQFREFVRRLTVRNIKVKYQRSMLGLVWTLLNPLLTVGVLVGVFSYVVRIPLPHYWAFVLSGYFAWNYMVQMLSAGPSILAEHAGLRRSVAFPAETLVIGAAASRLVEFGIELTLAVVALAVLHHHGVPASFVLVPVLVVLQVLLTIGLVMAFSTLGVFYHDVQHGLPIALMLLFYASPVFYPATLVPEPVREAYLLNPIASLLTLYHTVLYEGRFPSPFLLAGATLAALIAAAAGYAVFNRHKALFAEIL